MQGKWRECLEHTARHREAGDKARSSDRLAWNYLGLANLYGETRRPRDAEAFYRRALTLREEKLGAGHPLVRETVADYSGWLRAQGREGEAVELEARLATE